MDARLRKKSRGESVCIACLLALPLLLACSMASRLLTPANHATPSPTVPGSLTPTQAPPDLTPTPTTTEAIGRESEWGPSSIAFASNRSGTFQIYLVKPDGSELQRLTDSKGENTAPAWSQDGKRIFFVSTRDGNSEIYSMSPDGTQQTNLTNDPHEDLMPLGLAKGRVAFTSDRAGRRRIYLMNDDGSHLASLSRSSIDDTARMLCLVSLDEKVMLYTTEEGATRITRAVDATSGEAWIPRATSGQPDRSCPLTPLLDDTDWVMFVSNRDGHDEIYGYHASAQDDTRFTQGSEPSLGVTRSGDEGWVSYYSRQSGNWDIYVMDITGKGQWRITDDPSDDIQPAWQPYYALGTPTPMVSATPCGQANSIRDEQVEGMLLHFYCGLDPAEQGVVIETVKSSLRDMPAGVRPSAEVFTFADLNMGIRLEYAWLQREGYPTTIEELRHEWVTNEIVGEAVEGALFLYDAPGESASQRSILLRATVFHEMHHLAQGELENSSSRRPRWLVEGGAVAFAGREMRRLGYPAYSPTSGKQACDYSLVKLEDYHENVPFACYYTEGAKAVDLLLSEYGAPAYYQLFSETSRQRPFDAIFYSTYGFNLAHFYDLFDEYRKNEYAEQPSLPTPRPTGTAAPAPTAIPTMSASAAATPTLAVDKDWRTGRIAFASNRTGTYQIYLMKPDGTDPVQLTDSTGNNRSPVWSGDGKRIFFTSTRNGNSEIYSMNVDGTGQRNLTNNPHEDLLPVWFPSQQIAFVSDRGGSLQVYLMSTTGGTAMAQRGTAAVPGASFLCSRMLGHSLLAYTTASAGQRSTRFFDIETGDAWSPQDLNGTIERSCPFGPALDGYGWMYVESTRTGHDEIYRYDARLQVETALTHGAGPSRGPTYSANSQWVAYYSNLAGNWDIYITREDGVYQWDVTNNPADDVEPAWQPY